jgi:hypothetical protein
LLKSLHKPVIKKASIEKFYYSENFSLINIKIVFVLFFLVVFTYLFIYIYDNLIYFIFLSNLVKGTQQQYEIHIKFDKIDNLINNLHYPSKLINMTKHSLKLKCFLLVAVSFTAILASEGRTATLQKIDREMIIRQTHLQSRNH